MLATTSSLFELLAHQDSRRAKNQPLTSAPGDHSEPSTAGQGQGEGKADDVDQGHQDEWPAGGGGDGENELGVEQKILLDHHI